MAKDDTSGGATRLADYLMRKACGSELPTSEDWDGIDAGKITRAWEEICREACSGLIVIKAFRAAEKISKHRISYETELGSSREPILAEFFQEDVSFGAFPPYPIYYADKGILNAPWQYPVVFVLKLATPPSTPGRKPQWDWLKPHAMQLMDKNGDFLGGNPKWNTKTCLDRELLALCNGNEPAPSTLGKRTRVWVEEWHQLNKAGRSS